MKKRIARCNKLVAPSVDTIWVTTLMHKLVRFEKSYITHAQLGKGSVDYKIRFSRIAVHNSILHVPRRPTRVSKRHLQLWAKNPAAVAKRSMRTIDIDTDWFRNTLCAVLLSCSLVIRFCWWAFLEFFYNG